MYARHDLIWLTPLGWYAQLAAHPRALGAAADVDLDAVHTATSAAVLAARAVLERWRDRGWPLIVRRCEPGTPDDALCAGLAAPPDRATGAKLRIPLVVDRRHIARHEHPLPLQAVLPTLPARLQANFADFATAAERFDMRVYGSVAMQALTAQVYLHPASDIDVVFRPTTLQALDAGVALLAEHAQHLPLDGEIVFPSGEAVAWKEWHASHAGNARVLVKKASCVLLRPAEALRTELEAA
jgi:phosphoribosyl-dephospho-CoA transferase